MAEQEAEKAKLAKHQHHSPQSPETAENTTVPGKAILPKVVLPEGWHEMTEPGSNKVYYFNASTGETSDTVPTATAENAAENKTIETAFIPSAKFTKAKPGYIFTAGPQGVGYYLDKPEDKSLQSNTTAKQQDPLIGTTYQPLEKLEPEKALKRIPPRIERRKKATYASNFMDVVANSLSQYTEKQNPVTFGVGGNGVAQQNAIRNNTMQQKRNIAPPKPPPVMWQTMSKLKSLWTELRFRIVLCLQVFISYF